MENVPEMKRFEEYGMTGSAVEAFAGLAAVVLTIVGLAGYARADMIAVTEIVVGAALLVEAGLMGAEYNKAAAFTGSAENRRAEAEWGGGLSAEGAAGIAGIVLGILALIGLAPEILLACGTIVLGAGVMFGSGVHDRIRRMRWGVEEDRPVHYTSEALGAASGAQVLVGIGAIVLGILALIGFAPAVLNLVGLLAIGAVILWTGAAAGSHFYMLFRRS